MSSYPWQSTFIHSGKFWSGQIPCPDQIVYRRTAASTSSSMVLLMGTWALDTHYTCSLHRLGICDHKWGSSGIKGQARQRKKINYAYILANSAGPCSTSNRKESRCPWMRLHSRSKGIWAWVLLVTKSLFAHTHTHTHTHTIKESKGLLKFECLISHLREMLRSDAELTWLRSLYGTRSRPYSLLFLEMLIEIYHVPGLSKIQQGTRQSTLPLSWCL